MSYFFFFFFWTWSFSTYYPSAYDIFQLILETKQFDLFIIGDYDRVVKCEQHFFSHEHLKFHAANLLRVTDLHWLAS